MNDFDVKELGDFASEFKDAKSEADSLAFEFGLGLMLMTQGKEGKVCLQSAYAPQALDAERVFGQRAGVAQTPAREAQLSAMIRLVEKFDERLQKLKAGEYQALGQLPLFTLFTAEEVLAAKRERYLSQGNDKAVEKIDTIIKALSLFESDPMELLVAGIASRAGIKPSFAKDCLNALFSTALFPAIRRRRAQAEVSSLSDEDFDSALQESLS